MSQFKSMNANDLKKMRDDAVPHILLDVRMDQEVEICRIDGSTHIVMDEVPANLDQLDKDKKIIVHCKSGGRSAKVAQFLVQEGFGDVTNLEGGILGWIQDVDNSLTPY